MEAVGVVRAEVAGVADPLLADRHPRVRRVVEVAGEDLRAREAYLADLSPGGISALALPSAAIGRRTVRGVIGIVQPIPFTRSSTSASMSVYVQNPAVSVSPSPVPMRGAIFFIFSSERARDPCPP